MERRAAEGSRLRSMLDSGQLVRVIGVHDGITAILAEQAGFDALWVGGLAVSTAHGVPDAGLLTMTELHQAAVQVKLATALPVIADVDAGFGDVNVVRRMVRLYESGGIDAVCIEDKQYPKRNSFREGHLLEEPARFVRKIEATKLAQTTGDFMVIARLESLIAGAGMADALDRAGRYAEAGADALLVHSRAGTPHEIAEFCAGWRHTGRSLPILVVPTTYHGIHWQELWAVGVSAVIYANQLMRASVSAARQLLSDLSAAGSTTRMEPRIASLQDLFDLTGTDTLDDE
jgi:phosphoenolpyruvate phosphomutase